MTHGLSSAAAPGQALCRPPAPTTHSQRSCAPAGGYFIGTIPDAKRVLWHMGPHGRTDTPMLKLAAKWEVRRGARV